MERLIKNVDAKSWQAMKAEAAKHGKPIGQFLSFLVREHTKMEMKKTNWEIILGRSKTLSDNDAKVIKSALSVFEKETGFEE